MTCLSASSPADIAHSREVSLRLGLCFLGFWTRLARSAALRRNRDASQATSGQCRAVHRLLDDAAHDTTNWTIVQLCEELTASIQPPLAAKPFNLAQPEIPTGKLKAASMESTTPFTVGVSKSERELQRDCSSRSPTPHV